MRVGGRTNSTEACALCADMLAPLCLPTPIPPTEAIAMRQPDQRGAALNKTILTQRRRPGELCVLSAQTRRCSRRHMLTCSRPRSLGLVGCGGALMTCCCPCYRSAHRSFLIPTALSGAAGASGRCFTQCWPPPTQVSSGSVQKTRQPHELAC